MLKPAVCDALNEQINAEFASSYLYYSMSAWFQSVGLPGFAHWMQIQAIEEITHGHKLAAYVGDRGGQVVMQPIVAPPSEWESPLAAFAQTVAHEESITERINQLLDVAIDARDHATQSMLQWFVSEQVEEEATVGELLQKLRLIEQSQGALFIMDRDMGARPLPPMAMPQ